LHLNVSGAAPQGPVGTVASTGHLGRDGHSLQQPGLEALAAAMLELNYVLMFKDNHLNTHIYKIIK
jgi:hypothetical protein